MNKIKITKKDIDEMNNMDELEIFLSNFEDGVYDDFEKYELESGIYSYAVDKMWKLENEAE